MSARNPRGFTLMELLVVLTILALVAGLMVPKLVNVTERGRAATQAYSLTDVSRQLEIFFALNKKYPDGLDLLMDSTSSSTVYSKLAAELKSPNTVLTTATLSDTQIASLNSAGIGHAFLHDSTSAPSDSGTDRRHFGTGTGHDGTANVNTFVIVDKSSGSKGLSILVNDFGLNPNKSASDTTLTRITANTYVVMGLGNKSTLVQSQVLEAPFLDHSTSATAYSRALLVFEVPNAGTVKAKLVGVIGPDGRTKQMSVSDYNNVNGPQPH